MRDTITIHYLLYVVVPLWIFAGLADWWCHRRTRIAETSGLRESLIHVLMMSECGLAVVLGLLFDINALVIAIMIGAFFVHYATAWWDVAYAVPRREVTPTEQHVHGLLEIVPFAAVSFVICLHFDQFASLFGAGHEPARWTLAWKQPGLSPAYLVGLGVVIALFGMLPYAEELWRCWRARPRAERARFRVSHA